MEVSRETFAPYVMVFPVGSSLDFEVLRVSTRRVLVNRVRGCQPGMSALTLSGNVQHSLGRDLC